MGKTISEKVLSRKAGRDVTAGDVVRAKYDLAIANDASTPPTVERLREWDTQPKDPSRIALVPDHYVPSHDLSAQRKYSAMAEFSESYGIDTFYRQSEAGSMHVVLAEDGVVKPGDLLIGGDSHTVTYGALGVFATGVSYTDLAFAWEQGWVWLRVPETMRLRYTGRPEEWVSGKDVILKTIGQIGVNGASYRAIEFGGPLIDELSMDDRFTMANMTVEAGAKAGLFVPDATMRAYADARTDGDVDLPESDADATFVETVGIDCDGMEPQVAVPPSPETSRPVTAVEGVRIDQAVVGSCTNGRLEDLRQAATVLDGNHVDRDVRLIITPGSREVEARAHEEGWMELFQRAGAILGTPGCGACFGRRIGVLDEGEVAIATISRNYRGRMGADSSEVYLSNAAVAAASAIAGEIVHPSEVV